MAVSKALRFQVLRRDNHTCRYCGASAPDVRIVVDHVVPVALGGTDTPDNLVAACPDCNAGKAATDPGAALVADVAADALRWKAAREAAASMVAADLAAKEAVLSELYIEWERCWSDVYSQSGPPPIPADWEFTTERWYLRGLTLPILKGFIVKAVAKYVSNRRMPQDDIWRYYAGCCWSSLTEIEQVAKAALAEEASPDAP